MTAEDRPLPATGESTPSVGDPAGGPAASPLLPADDAGVARGVFVSATSQVGVQVLHMALNVVSSLLVIRYLPPSTYGDYVLVLVLMTALNLMCDFGLNRFAVKEVSVEPGTETEVVGTVVVLRLLLAAAAAVLIQLLMLALGKSAEVHTAAAVASLTFVGSALLSVTIAFHVRLQQQFEALTLLVGELVETSLVVWLVTHGGTVSQLFGAVAVGSGAAALAAIVLVRSRLSLHVRFARRRVAPLLRGAVPLAAANLAGIILLRIDVVVLAMLRTSREVGLYGAAMAPIEYLGIAGLVLVTVFLPLLGRYHSTDRPRFQSVYRLGTESLLVFVLPLAVVVALLAEPAVTLVYSSKYAGAVTPLRLLSFGLIVGSYCAWQATVLLSVGKQRLIFYLNSTMVFVGLGLQFVFVPWMGATGAALGAVLVGSFTAFVGWLLIHRIAGVTVNAGRVLRVAVAAAVIGAVALGLHAAGLGLWAATALGAAAYVPALYLLNVAPRHLLSVLTKESEPAVTAGVVNTEGAVA
ncbi:MAG: oligosaccharide flippase family protein [Acidimicrobiia bacterium]